MMRYNRVLLVNPPFDTEWRGLTPPIGIGYLAETLKHNAIPYDIMDMNLGRGMGGLQDKIDKFRPDLLGMSLISSHYRRFYRILDEVKRRYKGIAIVVGGPHVTILRDQVLNGCQAIDYGVVGEGERTLVDLCRSDTLKEIKGLLYRSDGGIVFSGTRSPVKNLDQIPWPQYSKFELTRYFPEINIYSSRGCPFQCIFCARHVLSSEYRTRSAQNVGDELEYWYTRGYRKFNIEDDNFNLDKERVYAICDKIDKRHLKGLTLRCSNGIRADRTDRSMLERMREVGFKYLAFGVDAGNDRMLGVIKKGETMETIETAIRNAIELGYTIKLFFVVGNPSETWGDVEDMVKLSQKYPIQEVHFNNTVPYPGTELYDWIDKHSYFLRQPDEFLDAASFWEKKPIFETPELNRVKRIKLTRYLKGVRKKVHRNAIQRRLHRYGFAGKLTSYVLANSILERAYYRSTFMRKLIERFRY